MQQGPHKRITLTQGRHFRFFFEWGGGGGAETAWRAKQVSKKLGGSVGGGGEGRAVSPPRENFLILSYFMCFLKPHVQGISAKIWYKNQFQRSRKPFKNQLFIAG